MEKGDTLYKVSRLYNISVDDICKYNKIKDITAIKIGTIILIPPGNTDSTSKSTSKATSKTETDYPDPKVMWPHPGKREKLNKILKGVAIEGKAGDFIISISQGKVIWADPFRGFGKMVWVMGMDNYIYVYAGNQDLLVGIGEEVFQNTRLAILQENTDDEKVKAYFFLYKDGKAVEPDFRPGK